MAKKCLVEARLGLMDVQESKHAQQYSMELLLELVSNKESKISCYRSQIQ